MLPDALVASAEIFSTHYTNGSLSVTAVLRGQPGATNYLVYLNRSTIDVLDGPFSSLKRRLIEHRVKADASHALEDLRRRLESGEPGGRP